MGLSTDCNNGNPKFGIRAVTAQLRSRQAVDLFLGVHGVLVWNVTLVRQGVPSRKILIFQANAFLSSAPVLHSAAHTPFLLVNPFPCNRAAEP